MIIPEIAELFPDAKFVFLFRNPVHVYASIVTTWGQGTLKRLYHQSLDLEEGPVLLSNGYAQLKDRAFALQYEEFVQNPQKFLEGLLEYLDLEFEESMLTGFTAQTPKGRMGDPTGVKKYSDINTGSLKKWKGVFNNRFRKLLLKNYILRLPEKALAIQGYDKQNIVEEVDSIKVVRFTPLQDYFHYFRSVLILHMKANLFFTKNMKWVVGKHLS
jgi:hypothetical protein